MENNPMGKKMIFTDRKGHLALFGDVSQEVHKRMSLHRTGSSDPHSDDFNAYAYLCDELMSKHPTKADAKSPEDRKRLAVAKLLSADASCRQINEYGFGDVGENLAYHLDAYFYMAQTLLGNLFHDWMDYALVGGNFSGGASQGFRMNEASPYKKFAGKATVTSIALPFAVAAIKAVPAWVRQMETFHGPNESDWLRIVDGNSVFTVPKNSEIDRAAAKEPDMNMYLQKSMGSFMRQRLRTKGIDLNDQTRNGELARLGSIDGSLATIDLSAASDSISRRLVMELFPLEMYMYLDMIRSQCASIDGQTHRWSLFSTMGNGCTFELETSIFWALARSVAILHNRGDAVVSVYGDDIIVDTQIAKAVIELLNVAGFSVNPKKTFIDGKFRESCGKHWYAGQDVTPFYIRKPITDITRLIVAANQLRRWQTSSGMMVSDPRLYSTWLWLSRQVDDRLHGGKDVNSSESLCSLDPPSHVLVARKRPGKIAEPVREWDENAVGDAELHPRRYEDGGRLVSYFHTNSEVSDVRVTTAYALRKKKVWSVPVPYFPQEVGVDELTGT
nr:MAG: hypothetical protein 3 [Leviviridae sp.]